MRMEVMIVRSAEKRSDEKEFVVNVGLSKAGFQQAVNFAKIVKEFKPTKILSSPLKRACYTADLIANQLEMTYEIDPLLREQETGDPNLPFVDEEDQLLKEPTISKGYVNPSSQLLNGETYQQLIDRIILFWKHLKDQYDIFLDEEDSNLVNKLVVITHRRFMTFLVAYALGFPLDGFFLEIPYTSYIILKTAKDWRTQIVLPTLIEKNSNKHIFF